MPMRNAARLSDCVETPFVAEQAGCLSYEEREPDQGPLSHPTSELPLRFAVANLEHWLDLSA
jgi:hypothetical protein